MSVSEWFKGLIGAKSPATKSAANGKGTTHPEEENVSEAKDARSERHSQTELLNDPRLARAVEDIVSRVQIAGEMITVAGGGSEGPVMQAANVFKELHKENPENAILHYAYAASLQVAMQGATASKTLQDCVTSHPDFWLARITLGQNALYNWNPFFLPEFKSDSGGAVHASINQIVRTNVLVATRLGVMPRAVMFLRDSAGEFDASKIRNCKLEFMTTISKITNPQVVAINGKIYDNPSDPFQCEILHCPVRPGGNKDRFIYEMFARQEYFEFVILDGTGRVKCVRRVTPSARMKSVNAKLAEMFDGSQGDEVGSSDVISALRRHQGIFDPKAVIY